jgi:pimeloyl-ACP methyl ester carboxylesterase
MKGSSALFFFLVLFLFLGACNDNPGKTLSPVNSTLSTDTIPVIKNEKLTYSQAYNITLKLFKTPLREIDVKTSFGNAHVIVSGSASAEPLVLLHGMNASSTMWYPNIVALSENYRVYAIDFLLEPGKSLCEGEIDNTEQILDWYHEIFESLQLGKFSIIGASRGGWLAMSIAFREKERIRKIVLLSPAQTFQWIKPGFKILSNVTYNMAPKRKRLRNVLETMTFDVDQIEQDYINQYYIATKEANTSKCILQMTPFSNEELSSLQIPVLLLIGDQDIINNEKSLERAKKFIKNVREETIENAGHFLSIDQPEIVNKKILDFLKDKDPLIVKK